MKRLNTFVKAAVLSVIVLLLHAPSVYAICPVCTIAVGAGLGLSRWLGIDDSVSGIWIGGFLLSSSLWFNNWLSKKNFFENKFRLPLVLVSMYALVLIPLWTTKVIGHPYNTILGIDKLVFGTIAGTLTFGFGVVADKMVRKIKGGQLFNFQKVVFPVVLLLIVSIVTYFYGGYLY